MRKNKYMRRRAEIRKCLAIGLTAAMCMAMLAGCSTSQSTSSTSDTEVTSDVSTETDADKESPNGSADAGNLRQPGQSGNFHFATKLHLLPATFAAENRK